MDILKQFTTDLQSKREKLSPATLRNYKADIARFITWFEHSTSKPYSPKAISCADIELYKQTMMLSYRSRERHLSSLRKFFHFLTRNGIVSHNPVASTVKREVLDFASWKVKDFENYLNVLNASKMTIKHYLLDLKQFLLWYSQKNIDRQVKQHFVDEYIINFKNQTEYSKATINRKQAAINKYLGWKLMSNH